MEKPFDFEDSREDAFSFESSNNKEEDLSWI